MAYIRPADAYRNVRLDTSVAAASPHQLILMLFQGARTALAHARRAIAAGDAAARGQALSKAAAIVDDGLKASLDTSKGGALAEQLDALYDYMVLRITLANAENDAAMLDEVDELLAGLEDSWRQIGAAPRAPQTPASAPARREALSYGKV